ncbi:MAG: hypothetical protein ABL971_06225 [Vicinamibacterales bacterium]
MKDQYTAQERQAVEKTISQIQGQGWGIAFGVACAIGLVAATNILILRGGPVIGPHLSLLRWYFPGYSMTVGGSLIGGVYAFVVGYGLGRMVATVYNRLTKILR